MLLESDDILHDNIEQCCGNCEYWTPLAEITGNPASSGYKKGLCSLQSSEIEELAIYGEGAEVFTPCECRCAEFEPCAAALEEARRELEAAEAIWETNRAMLREDGLLIFD